MIPYLLMFLFDFGVFFEFILYFQLLILSCRCNPQTVSPFIRFLSEPLHKRNIIHAYVVMPFPVLVLFKRESRILVTKLSVEFRRIEITFQPYFLQLAQFLGNPFRKMQGVSAGVNQQQQLLRLDFFPYFIKLPFRPLLFYLLLRLIGFKFSRIPYRPFNIKRL